MTLGSVLDHTYDYTKKKKTGFLSKKVVTKETKTSTEIGSLVGASKDVVISAGHDLSVAGTISGGNNVTVSAGNKLDTNGLNNTYDYYYKKKKSGLAASLSGGKISVGYSKQKKTDTEDTTTITPTSVRSNINGV